MTPSESIACVAKCGSPVVVLADRGLRCLSFRPRLHVKRNSWSACEQDVVRHDYASYVFRLVQQKPRYGFSHRLPVSHITRARSWWAPGIHEYCNNLSRRGRKVVFACKFVHRVLSCPNAQALDHRLSCTAKISSRRNHRNPQLLCFLLAECSARRVNGGGFSPACFR